MLASSLSSHDTSSACSECLLKIYSCIFIFCRFCRIFFLNVRTSFALFLGRLIKDITWFEAKRFSSPCGHACVQESVSGKSLEDEQSELIYKYVVVEKTVMSLFAHLFEFFIPRISLL